MLRPTDQPDRAIQFRSSTHSYPPHALAIPADPLAPARSVVFGTLLSTVLWAGSIGLALRFIS